MKSMRRSVVLFVLAAVIAAVLVALPAAAAPSDPYGGKVDASLLAVVNAPDTTSTTPLHAIVYGSDLTTANAASRHSDEVRQPLGKIGGESVTIRRAASRGSRPRRASTTSTLDAEVVPTGGVTKAPLDGNALVTDYPVTDGAVDAWKKGIDGKDVGVAVIDSGTDAEPSTSTTRSARADQAQGPAGRRTAA